ncbi:MAG: hypothetical protein Kow0068_19260 [Marinilabiliales bacterium]
MKTLITLTCLFLFVYFVNGQIPTDNLIGYWPFNGNANDSSINNNNGTVIGATLTFDRFGNPNSAYSFDGIDDYIDLNDTLFSTDDSNQPYTISVWIKSSAYNGVILSQYAYSINPPPNRFLLMIRTSYVDYWKGGTSNFSNSVVNDNQWHHIVAVKDTSGTISLFVDGSLDGTGNDFIDFWGTNTLIGNGLNSGDPFNGTIDDLRIYNRALTESEITAIYNETVSIVENTFDVSPVIYPNPTNGHVKIKFSEIQNNISITVSDVNGKLLSQSKTSNTNLIEVNIDGTSGIYLLNVNSGNNRFVVKLLKK